MNIGGYVEPQSPSDVGGILQGVGKFILGEFKMRNGWAVF
jgi:hypothetical protein